MSKTATKDKNSDKVSVPEMALDAVLAIHDEENPRLHKDDIEPNAISLLRAGWGEVGVVYNAHLNKLAGGHGRTMSADWLRQRDEDWFEVQWEIWLGNSAERKEIAHLHRHRYNSEYWQTVPVNTVYWDEQTHRAMLARLNNSAVEGKDDPKRMAALLSKLPKADTELAGWTEGMAKAFTAQFLERKKELEEREAEEEVERSEIGKQLFQRPDATDYSVRDEDDPEDATLESGEVSSYIDDDEATWEEEDSDSYSVDQSGAVSVNTADIEDTTADVFKHSSHYSETRALLYVSHEGLEEWKTLSRQCSILFEVDTKAEIAKIWRSQANMAALRWAVESHPNRHLLVEQPNADPESSTD